MRIAQAEGEGSFFFCCAPVNKVPERFPRCVSTTYVLLRSEPTKLSSPSLFACWGPHRQAGSFCPSASA